MARPQAWQPKEPQDRLQELLARPQEHLELPAWTPSTLIRATITTAATSQADIICRQPLPLAKMASQSYQLMARQQGCLSQDSVVRWSQVALAAESGVWIKQTSLTIKTHLEASMAPIRHQWEGATASNRNCQRPSKRQMCSLEQHRPPTLCQWSGLVNTWVLSATRCRKKTKRMKQGSNSCSSWQSRRPSRRRKRRRRS